MYGFLKKMKLKTFIEIAKDDIDLTKSKITKKLSLIFLIKELKNTIKYNHIL